MIIRQSHLKRGFTLLELLVALSIFSLVSVMAYGGLQTVIKTKNITQQSADRIAEVQLLMMRISDDLRQAVSRKIRDEYGDFLPAMQSGKNGNETIAWTRLGYRNPARLTRSNIQRVAYKLEQQKLVRITWPVLDRAQDTKELNSEVLSNVESIEWRFMNNNNEWLSTWPDEGENMVLYPLPKAVEVTLELQDWGKIKRLILVASDT
ncbi:MAG: type II secretion system minor pseudopilin GspJ [Gammaproteobacteria bacterium]|nr:type II secretion system minor pseudopilin GspJ [Gammaproteobacteria bacterium]